MVVYCGDGERCVVTVAAMTVVLMVRVMAWCLCVIGVDLVAVSVVGVVVGVDVAVIAVVAVVVFAIYRNTILLGLYLWLLLLILPLPLPHCCCLCCCYWWYVRFGAVVAFVAALIILSCWRCRC